MNFKDKLIIANNTYNIFNINRSNINHLPYSIKVLFENYIRNNYSDLDNEIINYFLNWNGKVTPNSEINFLPSRVIMQDFTGVPAIVDLDSMRDAVKKNNGDPSLINPQCQTDLVIDHSVMVDHYGSDDASDLNIKLEYQRNAERYRLLKWGQSAFKNLRVIPPNNGIIHQINIEYISKVIFSKNNILYPDTVVGTDSHTTMVNGLGVLGWGVGGIEAEASMLGQPIPMLLPEVIGFELKGDLKQGSTATDLVLTIVEMLREKNVVGKFVEFFGDGLDNLSIADRCTISNMAPEYGATCGFFPIDGLTLKYLNITGKSNNLLDVVEQYSKLCGLYRNTEYDIKYSDTLSLNISKVQSCISGPKKPEDRVNLSDVNEIATQEIKKLKTKESKSTLIDDGSILIAAITSCTNTSNPNVIIGAGLLAKNAVEKGIMVKKWVKTSLAPGSRVVKNYLEKSGLLKYFDFLGFNIVGFGCTTCIGNSGPLKKEYTDEILKHELIVSSILSGNRNFEGRIHPDIKMNFLASPMLVIAYSLIGKINIDINTASLGKDKNNNDVFLKDIWPSSEEISQVVEKTITREMFENSYKDIYEGGNEWNNIKINQSDNFEWEKESTYIQPSPFFKIDNKTTAKLEKIENAYPLVVLGDSVTTDHISPAGSFKDTSPAGEFLLSKGTKVGDFNSYGSRRGNYKIMERGTFANVRLANKLVPDIFGGYTNHIPTDKVMTIYEAAQLYKQSSNNLIIFAGKNYGCGSSRDWAAKGTKLLGVKAVIAQSFERIHRSNLIGMGILPLQFINDDNFDTLELNKYKTFTISAINKTNEYVSIQTDQNFEFKVKIRIDTEMEWNYFLNDGILNFVLKKIINY